MEKTQTIEEAVAEMLNNRKEEIIKNGIEGVTKAVQDNLSWKIQSIIGNQVEKLFEDEDLKAKMTEEVTKVKIKLVESLASELEKVAPSIAVEIATNIQKKAIKNLTEDSYSMREFYKKLFE